MIALRLPPEIEERLVALARLTGQSVEGIVRDAVLNSLQDLEDVAIADRRMEALRRGESETTTLADVLARYA